MIREFLADVRKEYRRRMKVKKMAREGPDFPSPDQVEDEDLYFRIFGKPKT